MMHKNIGFAKIGKSIKFASKYSPIGGDNEAPSLLQALANNNPDRTFWIMGRSDFYKLEEHQYLKLFPYGNVKDCWEGHKGVATFDKLEDFSFDACIFMIGQIGTVTIPGKIQQVKDRSLIASVIDMTKNYSTPIINWWNDHPEVPVIEIINDPRYTLHQSRDIINNPKASLSQFEYSYKKSTIESYENQDRIDHTIPVKYAEMEKIFLYGKKKTIVGPRGNPFMIVLNEGSPSRYNMLKEWVLDYNENVEIWGKYEKEEALSDPRFKGTAYLDEIQKKLNNVKATFIIPIAPGWATSKYVEMIYAGVIPFFHPTYDSDKNIKLSKQVRDFLIVKSPEDLQKRVNEISSDDNLYNTVISELYKEVVADDFISGRALSRNILSELEDDYELPDLSKFSFAEKESSTLDDFFS